MSDLESYFHYLDQTQSYNPEAASQQRQHQIQNLYTVTLLTHACNKPAFAKLFWNLFFTQWSEVKRQGQTQYFHQLNTSKTKGDNVPGFIQYFTRTQPCLPDTSGNCYKAQKLFTPKLAPLFGQINGFPILDLPDINDEQAEFLGIRSNLTLEECLQILQYCAMQQHVSPYLAYQIEQIYGYINDKLESHRSEEAQHTAQHWNGTLLAADNTFQSPKMLYFFNMPDISWAHNRQLFLHELRLPLNKLSNICKLFGITEVNNTDLQLQVQDKRPSNELKALLRSRIIFLAKYVHYKRGGELETIKFSLLEQLEKTEFYTASSLHLTYKNNPDIYKTSITCFLNDNYFYHLENWRQVEHLFLLTKQLCLLLDITDIGGEMQLFLTLDEGGIVRWLRSMDIDVRNEIGFLGEKEIFFSLKKTLALQYATAQITETETGFELTNSEGNLIARLQWYNYPEESYLPYDFTLTTFSNGQPNTETTQYIEIKTTSDENNDIIYVTASEWVFMLEQHSNYCMYRVYLDYSNNYHLQHISHIEVPLQHITKGQLLPIGTIALLVLPPTPA